MGFFSFGFSTVCVFFISKETTSLGEIFITDISNGIKFQPSITITSMHGGKGFLATCTKFKSRGSGGLMACPFILEMSWRSQVEPDVSSIGKEGRTVCEREGEKIHMHFIHGIPPLLSFSATSLCISSLNPLIYAQAFL